MGTLVGVAVGVASGKAEAGPSGRQELARRAAQRNLLKYTREQEGVADQAAFGLLEATQRVTEGHGFDFFSVLQRQEAL